MTYLLWLAFKNQWLSHLKKPIEFISSLIAIFLNNSFYLYGIYLIAILSVQDDPGITKEYIISTGVILTSWGLLNVFAGGLFKLGAYIESGELETFLAKPRSPLLLIAISKSNLLSLSDLFQGIFTIIIAVFLCDIPFGIRLFVSSFITTFALASIAILAGTFSFLSSQGSQLSNVLQNVILTLSMFPMGRALQGKERWLLYLTPLLVTATLPRKTILESQNDLFLNFAFITAIFFWFSIIFFNWSLNKYKSKNYIFLNS